MLPLQTRMYLYWKWVIVQNRISSKNFQGLPKEKGVYRERWWLLRTITRDCHSSVLREIWAASIHVVVLHQLCWFLIFLSQKIVVLRTVSNFWHSTRFQWIDDKVQVTKLNLWQGYAKRSQTINSIDIVAVHICWLLTVKSVCVHNI